MAKYIIDIPDEKTYAYVNNEKTFLRMPISLGENNNKSISVPTMLRIKPYTESDRKVIDLQYARDIENVARMNYNEGAKDAWDFAKAINYMGYDDFVSCFGGKTEEVVYELSYSEVKAKYDAWKDKIRVGDEVIDKDVGKAIVTYIDFELCNTLWLDGSVSEDVPLKDLHKTGRHFNEVEEMLNKMKEQ